MKQRPLVVYWNNIPSPYMVERFNAVADRGNLRFEAWFNERLQPGRSWDVDESTWKFSYRYVPSIGALGHRVHLPTLVLRRRPDVLVSLYAEPVFIAGWLLAKLLGTTTAFWCQVTHDSWVPRRRWKDMVKRGLFRRVDATLGSGEDSRQFAIRYGTPPHKALRLPHVIDAKHFTHGADLARQARGATRRRMGLVGTTYIYVGRLWWGKGLPHLIEAFGQVQRSLAAEVSLLLVGDGPDGDALRELVRQSNLRNVQFAGFQKKQDLPLFYSVSDVFVFPTLGDPYGMVIDEAMACSLPIVSTSAVGEIHERVEQGTNGFIVPPGDSAEMAAKMIELAEGPRLRQSMGRRSRSRVEGNTPEKWARELELIVARLVERRAEAAWKAT